MTPLQLFTDPAPSTWTPDQPLRALSWKQPYAELMRHQKIETRTWATKYRGWVLICTSKAEYEYNEVLAISGPRQSERIVNVLLPDIAYMLTGYAIAIGYLNDCRPMTPEDEDATFVQYRPGLWCHVYTDVQAIYPIPWKGSQGWREVGPEFKNQIKFLEP